MATTIYTPKQLEQEARAAVKGLGRYDGWEIRITMHRVSLLAFYIPSYNPNRPKAQQARCQTSVAI